jgi:biopolymer transport protein ExbD
VRRTARRGADIDITPLIDVLFMLIIFFVLTTVFVQGSVDVELPKGDAPPLAHKNPIVVTVTKDARILWAGDETPPAGLPGLAAKALAASEDILIAGDRETPYGEVASLLDRLRNLGVESVGLAFEEDEARP